MRSYNQHCALAKALDAVGDRWTLLIVRELLIRGACRYTDLRQGLPGIATNLLAARLRELEAAGIVARETAAPPVATALVRLTPRGQALEPVILELGRWGAALLERRRRTDGMLGHWIVMPLRLHLRDREPAEPARTIAIRADSQEIVIAVAGGAVDIRMGRCEQPDATLEGDSEAILKFLAGRADMAAARRAGVHIGGDPAVFRRVIP